MKKIWIIAIIGIVSLVVLYFIGRYKALEYYRSSINEIIPLESIDKKIPDYQLTGVRLAFGDFYLPHWVITFKDNNAHRGFGSCSWYYATWQGGTISIQY